MTEIQITLQPGDDLERLAVLLSQPGGKSHPQDPHDLSGSRLPHRMKTITSWRDGWDTVKVVGDIGPDDIGSLKSATDGAFLKRPVRLVIDLSEVNCCCSEGIHWILETRQRIARCGGELRVVVLPNGSGLKAQSRPAKTPASLN